MSVSSVVNEQPHMHAASLMHAQSPLVSLPAAPSNRPTSGGGLDGLLNADNAIPNARAGPVTGGGSFGGAPGVGMRDQDVGNMPLANASSNGYRGNLSQ